MPFALTLFVMSRLSRKSLILSLIALAVGSQASLGYSAVPKLPFFKNWGVSGSDPQASIHAIEAWKIQKGSPRIIVAVIDTGIDATHPDLKMNLWQDPLSGREVHGWDFVTDRPNVNDEHGHGTHIAGIIGAIANPMVGVAGVAQRVAIMAVKYYSDRLSGAKNLYNSVRAINYAVDHGAKIINYSGGGPEFSEEEFLAVKRAERRGVLFVAAAGNLHQDIDQSVHYYYPASYRLSNIISVASIDRFNHLLPSSNWGRTRVDVAAPGEEIFSTMPRDRKTHLPTYGEMTGTSQATAFVSGLAALILSENPSLSPAEVREVILRSVDPIPGLKGKILTGGKINALKAVKVAHQFVPSARAVAATQSLSSH